MRSKQRQKDEREWHTKLLLYKLLAGAPGHDTGQGNPVLRALLSGRTPLGNF